MQPDQVASRRSRRAFFVYYKLATSKISSLVDAFPALTATSQPWEAQLMRRAHACTLPSDLQTWMEIYWLHDEGGGHDDAALRQMIEAIAADAGILELIDGPRHYEVFESCA